MRSSNGERRLFNDDLGTVGDLGDVARSQFPVLYPKQQHPLKNDNEQLKKEDHLEISGRSSSDSKLLGRGVDGDEDHLGFLNRRVQISGEEQILPTNLLHHLIQTRLKAAKQSR